MRHPVRNHVLSDEQAQCLKLSALPVSASPSISPARLTPQPKNKPAIDVRVRYTTFYFSRPFGLSDGKLKKSWRPLPPKPSLRRRCKRASEMKLFPTLQSFTSRKHVEATEASGICAGKEHVCIVNRRPMNRNDTPKRTWRGLCTPVGGLGVFCCLPR